jgi:hypothetical protein
MVREGIQELGILVFDEEDGLSRQVLRMQTHKQGENEVGVGEEGGWEEGGGQEGGV